MVDNTSDKQPLPNPIFQKFLERTSLGEGEVVPENPEEAYKAGLRKGYEGGLIDGTELGITISEKQSAPTHH